MPPQTARSLMKDFRNSFRRKKTVESTSKTDAVQEAKDEAHVKLAELKESMGDNLPPKYTDEELIGFLKARSLDVKEAEKLVKLDENVKRLLNVESYYPNPEIHPYNFSSAIGFNKEGSLIRVMNIGHSDLKGIVHRVSTIEINKILLKMASFDMNLQEAENRKKGRNVRQIFCIVNVENLGMHHISCKAAVDTALQILKLMQDHYHDTLKHIYIVNASSFFSSAYKIFKPVLQEYLQERIKILDHGNSKEELLKVIDADVLPKYLGGNRVDSNGDPNCSEFIPFGFEVPEESYASNFLEPDDPDVVSVTIAAGAKVNYRFPVREVGSVFKWHIQSKDYDLAIGVFIEPFPSGNETSSTQTKKEEDMSRFEPVTPLIRSQCHICPEEDSAVLWFTGNLILHFDNSYSWMNPKEVMFKISIIPPTNKEKNMVNSSSQAAQLMSKISLSY